MTTKEYCNECAVLHESPRTMVGVSPKGFWAHVTCDGCGEIYVDHAGDRQADVQTKKSKKTNPREEPLMYNDIPLQQQNPSPQAQARVYPMEGNADQQATMHNRQQEFQRILNASVETQLRPVTELVTKIVNRIQEIETYLNNQPSGSSDGLQPKERLMITLYKENIMTRSEVRAGFGLPDDTPLAAKVSPVAYAPVGDIRPKTTNGKKRGRPKKIAPLSVTEEMVSLS